MLLDGHFPSDAFVVHAAVCPPISGFLRGVARECHTFAQAFARANPDFIHMTGLARSSGLWVCHSWIACAGQTLEVTPIPRDTYFGFDLALAAPQPSFARLP